MAEKKDVKKPLQNEEQEEKKLSQESEEKAPADKSETESKVEDALSGFDLISDPDSPKQESDPTELKKEKTRNLKEDSGENSEESGKKPDELKSSKEEKDQTKENVSDVEDKTPDTDKTEAEESKDNTTDEAEPADEEVPADEEIPATTEETASKTEDKPAEAEATGSNAEEKEEQKLPEKVLPADDNAKSEKQDENKEGSEDKDHEEYEFGEDEDHEEDEDEDYEKLSKEELLERIKELTGRDVLDVSEKRLDAIREAFYHHIDHEREEALEEFLKEEGNTEDDFVYQKDKDLIQQFKTYYEGFRDQKKKLQHDLNRLKEENLKKKEEILERLRQFVDEDEDNVGIKTLKEIETEWKEAEPIPNNYTRELWANFNALRDRFYDKRSIFFELKELDRKKNEKLKKEVIEKAKELLTVNPVNVAVTELKKLHDEYKHIGPVPNEIRPVLWEEFKKISDQIHERKQAVSAEFKKKLDENLERKKELIIKLEEFMDFSSDKIAEWNEKSKSILNIQEEWRKIGPVPREISKEISKSFWSHFKSFFKNKQQFFKKLDEARENNYEEKVKLVEEVEELNKTAEDFSEYSDHVKKLQREWKKIGPAPRKKSEEVYKRFKQACDEFFDNLRGKQKDLEKDYEKNLEAKNKIVDKIKAIKELNKDNLEEVEALIREWSDIGFVPKRAIRSSKNAIQDAMNDLFKKVGEFGEQSADMVETKLKALLLKADFKGSKNIYNEIDKMKRQISKLQDNAVQLKNNMEFFASTKNAEKLKDDVQKKIDRAEEEIENLKEKIKVLRKVDK